MTKGKRTYKTLHKKLKIEEHEPLTNKTKVFWKGKQFLFHILASFIAVINVKPPKQSVGELMCFGRVSSFPAPPVCTSRVTVKRNKHHLMSGTNIRK